MALINANALREYYKINEHCEECHWNNRDCNKPPYYSTYDICMAIDEVPIIDAIPVEWLEDKELYYRTTGDKMFSDAFAVVIGEWQKEHEVTV